PGAPERRADVVHVREWPRAPAVRILGPGEADEPLVVRTVVPVVEEDGEQPQSVALGPARALAAGLRPLQLVPPPSLGVGRLDRLAFRPVLDGPLREGDVRAVVELQLELSRGRHLAVHALTVTPGIGRLARHAPEERLRLARAAEAAERLQEVHVVRARPQRVE